MPENESVIREFFAKLKEKVDEVCSPAFTRFDELEEVCRELRRDIDLYEKLVRYRRRR